MKSAANMVCMTHQDDNVAEHAQRSISIHASTCVQDGQVQSTRTHSIPPSSSNWSSFNSSVLNSEFLPMARSLRLSVSHLSFCFLAGSSARPSSIILLYASGKYLRAKRRPSWNGPGNPPRPLILVALAENVAVDLTVLHLWGDDCAPARYGYACTANM